MLGILIFAVIFIVFFFCRYLYFYTLKCEKEVERAARALSKARERKRKVKEELLVFLEMKDPETKIWYEVKESDAETEWNHIIHLVETEWSGNPDADRLLIQMEVSENEVKKRRTCYNRILPKYKKLFTNRITRPVVKLFGYPEYQFC